LSPGVDFSTGALFAIRKPSELFNGAFRSIDFRLKDHDGTDDRQRAERIDIGDGLRRRIGRVGPL
jgi:hypothetical protein